MEEKFFWLGFSVFPGVGPLRFQKLLDHFGSAKAAWDASESELRAVIGNAFTEKFIAFRKSFVIEQYTTELAKKKVTFVTLPDDAYPQLLKNTPNPPFVLYIKGELPLLIEKPIAIVGARAVSQYGRDVTRIISKELVNAGCTIISGLAMGVDGIAHATTIENKGKTVAVLGCGVDCCYPSSNQQIYDGIVKEGGAIVSEFAIGMPPSPGSFPSRNRIIAGLSQGVVVTEGAEDSGTLITAEYAMKFERKVYAVPGPITSQLSKGPYKLINKGAKLVTSGRDILEDLQIGDGQLQQSKKAIKGDTNEEQNIIDLLAIESLHFDDIVRKTNMDSTKIGILLSMMEMKGLLQQQGGMFSLAT